MSEESKGTGISLGVTANRGKLLAELLHILEDLEELEQLSESPETLTVIKRMRDRLAGLIEVK